MSLKVWLPLTGNLNQIGTKEYEITAFRGSIIFHDNGKIGKCFHANGVNTLKINNIIPDIYNYTAYSLCAWIYIETNNTSHSGSAIISGGNWNNQLLNLAVSDWSSDHYTKLRISGTNWNRTYNYNFNKNTWYHVIVCDDGIHTYAYVNGILIGNTATSFLPSSIEGTDLCIGGATYYAGMQFFGRINDVRIYDHCLSAAEVHEISQGLVLHYKLDSFQGGYGNPNLLPASDTTFFNTTRSFEFQGWVNNFYTTTWVNEHLTVGQQYTLSYTVTCISIPDTSIYSVSETRASPILVHQGSGWSQVTTTNDGIKSTNLLPGQSRTYKCTFTFATATESQGYYGFCGYTCLYRNADRTSTAYAKFKIENLKLELGNDATPWVPNINDESVDITHVQDSSDYNHNGAVNGNLSIISDSSRYSSGIFSANGATGYIQTPLLNMPTDAITLNIWFKTTSNAPTSDYHMIVDSVGNSSERQHYEMCIYKTGYFRGGLFVNGTRYADNCTTTTGCNGNWHMLTLTYDGTAIKRYFDGNMEKSTTVAKSSGLQPTATLRLFKDGYSSYACINTSLSDFRIYCTALSADDIKQLYELGAKIDNNGNIHTFEFKESVKESINKNGQFLGHNIIEPYLPLYDKTIYIEPDGSTWIHIFHHNNPSASKFDSTTSDWLLGKFIDTDRWYDADQAILNSLSPYEFMVKQKTSSSATETKYRWKQNPNPLIASWDDVKPGTVTFNTTSGYSSSSFGGLYLFKTGNLHMCIANGSNGNWYGGIGAATAYNGGIPGFPNTTVTDGYIDLYMRIYSGAKIIKEIGINGNNLIEF